MQNTGQPRYVLPTFKDNLTLFKDYVAHVNHHVTQTNQPFNDDFFFDLQVMYQELNNRDASTARRFIATILPLLTDSKYANRYSSLPLRLIMTAWLFKRA
jgi:hypothetical protein